MRRKKGRRAAVVAVGLSCLLSACGDKPPEPPADYALSGESVESLNTVVGAEKSGTMTQMETPETEESGDKPSSSAVSGEICLYTYTEMETGGDTVRLYVEKLTNETGGFKTVDESGVTAEPPDYTAETGAVALAKLATEEGKILRMDISWTATDCQITLTRPVGEVTEPAVEVEPMGNREAVDYIKGLSPAKLGLTGESLQDYSIYPIDGSVMVDGNMCLKLQAYPPRASDKANTIAGTFLLSGDKLHLYALKDGAVKELQIG